MTSANAGENRILARLPRSELAPLLSNVQDIALPIGHEVFREGMPTSHVYFPTTGVYAIVLLMQGGERVEVMTIGNEGMLGLPLFQGLDAMSYTVVSQVPGEVRRVPAATFLRAARPGNVLDRLLRRYAAYQLRAVNQIVACNTLHRLVTRMCRWLLMAHDRVGQDEFPITQESLSELLGVRRQTISIVARSLQQEGLITYRRGILRVLNRKALESVSCECYEITKALYTQIMFRKNHR